VAAEAEWFGDAGGQSVFAYIGATGVNDTRIRSFGLEKKVKIRAKARLAIAKLLDSRWIVLHFTTLVSAESLRRMFTGHVFYRFSKQGDCHIADWTGDRPTD
jgi:hypothetical protein